jgi:hypothetical protein
VMQLADQGRLDLDRVARHIARNIPAIAG